MFAATSTPPAMVAELEKASPRPFTIHDVAARLKALAINPSNDTPEQFKELIESDIVKFRNVVKTANLKFED